MEIKGKNGNALNIWKNTCLYTFDLFSYFPQKFIISEQEDMRNNQLTESAKTCNDNNKNGKSQASKIINLDLLIKMDQVCLG